MAEFSRIVTTNAGIELLAAASLSGGAITFTGIRSGSGTYDGSEDLKSMMALKNQKQAFGISGVSRTGAVLKVRAVLSNEGLTQGYNVTELGLYASNNGSEILYAIMIAETGKEDYFPPFAETPTTVTIEMYLTISDSENVTFEATVLPGVYVTVEDFTEHTEDNVRHVTAAERTAWNEATITFTDVPVTPVMFLPDTTYPDYPFKANVPCLGVTADYIPIVNFAMEQATSGNYAPIALAGDDEITIYAIEDAASQFSIPTIVCIKGGA